MNKFCTHCGHENPEWYAACGNCLADLPVAKENIMDHEYNDGRLNEADFVAKFGHVLAMSSWGARWVGSALTRKHYIYFDHKTGQYAQEAR